LVAIKNDVQLLSGKLDVEFVKLNKLYVNKNLRKIPQFEFMWNVLSLARRMMLQSLSQLTYSPMGWADVDLNK